MPNYSQITLLGHLTADPEAGTLPNTDTETSRFGIAVNTRKGDTEMVTFYRVNFIGKVAGVANQFLKKGNPALIVGEPRLETFTKKDGSMGASIEVRGNTLQLIGGAPQAKAASAGAEVDSPSDDIPF